MEESKIKIPFYILFHPIDGIETMKWKKTASYKVSAVILLVWVISTVISRTGTGFAYNEIRPGAETLPQIILVSFGVFLLAVISNALLCTLMTGEAKFVEIWCAIAYPLIILTFCNILVTALSQVVPLELAAFLRMIQGALIIWFGAVLFFSIMTAHQFSFGKAVINIILTLATMLLIVFIILLLFSLFQQLFSFCYVVFNELIIR